MTVNYIGSMASGWGRDLNVCQHNIGKVKLMANRGGTTNLANANSLLLTVISNLQALQTTLAAQTQVVGLDTLPTLPDPSYDSNHSHLPTDH